MISQPPWPHKPLALFVLYGLIASAHAAPPAPRLGGYPLDEPALREILDHARVMEHARSERPPPRAALKQRALLQSVLRRGLEAQLASAMSVALDLWPDPLVEARALGATIGADEVLDFEVLVEAIEARYGAPFSLARRALLTPHRLNQVSEALVERYPIAEARAAYLQRETQLRLDVALVNRVPAGREIDQLIRAEPQALQAYYVAHPRLFSTPPRVIIQRLSFKDTAAAEAARAQAQAGVDLSTLGGRAQRLVRAQRREPALYALADGALTPPRPDGQGGASFDQVTGHLPGVSRRLSDMRVRREIAAALLRERDTLPQARALAEAARVAFEEGRGVDLQARPGRLKLLETRAFTRGRLVPGLGLAPTLNARVFELPLGGVTSVMTLRQHYVVARVKHKVTPTEADWRAAAPEFIPEWRARVKREALSRLSAEVGDQIVLGELEAVVSAWINEGS